MKAELIEKKSFIYYIAHEVRNPLNTVSMSIDVLSADFMGFRGRIGSETESTLVDMRKCCDDAINILNETLLMEKLKGGTVVLETEEMQVERFVAESVRPFHIQVCMVLPTLLGTGFGFYSFYTNSSLRTALTSLESLMYLISIVVWCVMTTTWFRHMKIIEQTQQRLSTEQ